MDEWKCLRTKIHSLDVVRHAMRGREFVVGLLETCCARCEKSSWMILEGGVVRVRLVVEVLQL